MKTINITELQTFLIAFYNQEFPEQRLGQAFMNVMKLTETNTDIFYEPNNICFFVTNIVYLIPNLLKGLYDSQRRNSEFAVNRRQDQKGY